MPDIHLSVDLTVNLVLALAFLAAVITICLVLVLYVLKQTDRELDVGSNLFGLGRTHGLLPNGHCRRSDNAAPKIW